MARIRKNPSEENGKKIWRLGKYLRLSKEDLLAGDSRSIISQDMTLDNHIDNLIRNGEHIVIAGTYVDDGTSGMYDSRNDFQRAIKDIENGIINGLIVCDLSRMFRNDADQKQYLEYYFREKKTRIISCILPQLDTYYDPDRIYSMDVKFQGMTNANMPIENSLKIKDKLANRRKRGLFVGSFAPYGYKKDHDNKNKLLVDDEAAEVVKDIYNWFVYERMSIRRIVEKLNTLGIANPTQYKKEQGLNFKSATDNCGLWSESTVRNILTREYYIGNMDQHHSQTIFMPNRKKVVKLDYEEKDSSELVENTHEAIIELRTYELTQKLLTRDTRTAPTQKHTYLFSGYLVCGDCKKAMIAKKAKNINYYYCSTYLKRSKTACTKHTTREDVLTEVVLKTIQLQVALAVSLREKVDKISKSEKINKTSKRIESLLSSNKNALIKQENIQDNLYIDWKNGDITREQHNRMRMKTEDKIQQLKNEGEELQREKIQLESNVQQNNQYLETFCRHENITELDNKILIELVDKIHIYEKDKIEIKFNFADEYKLTLEFIKNNK